ncbi:MAG: phosphoribosylanthranilate isomerase [Acidobacteria bacterium]|nr:MAG: phosphoribosylanthranilate isomerase [Acidobacteriota bacterium]
MHVRVKICGITDAAALRAAVEGGADAVGFVFAGSPRAVIPHVAAALADSLPPYVSPVAVFARPTREELSAVLEVFRPDWIQADFEAEGGVPPRYRSRFLPVFRARPGIEEEVERYLGASPPAGGAFVLDGPVSGSGEPVDWETASRLARRAPLVLAGGLTPENVGEAIRTVRPYAVDVSSGVESEPGRKDPAKIAAFLEAVREAERELRGEQA